MQIMDMIFQSHFVFLHQLSSDADLKMVVLKDNQYNSSFFIQYL